jgi:hypothetical protein
MFEVSIVGLHIYSSRIHPPCTLLQVRTPFPPQLLSLHVDTHLSSLLFDLLFRLPASFFPDSPYHTHYTQPWSKFLIFLIWQCYSTHAPDLSSPPSPFGAYLPPSYPKSYPCAYTHLYEKLGTYIQQHLYLLESKMCLETGPSYGISL